MTCVPSLIHRLVRHFYALLGHQTLAIRSFLFHLLLGSFFAAPAASAQDEPWLKARPELMQRWQDLGFGLFMHWDPSSILGVEISWHRQSPFNGPIPDDVYDNLYRSFYPGQFDAAAIAKTAKDAGMKYIVITAKHHGGFSLFDSAYTDYDIMSTPFKRDIIKELADATRAARLLFGLYYSQPDWHHPAFLAKDWETYNKFLYGQLRELCTNYGEISMIFFDAISYGSDQYRPKELFKMIRELQPNVVINDRCGLPGDYSTPEQVVGAFQVKRPWETCMTLGTAWSWKTYDKVRSPAECVRLLVMTAGSGGNLLLNVGPMPTGQIEPRQAEVLQKVGNWLSRNGHALLGHRAGPYKPALWGASVHDAHTIYLHILSWADLPELLPALPTPITSITHLDGRPVAFTHDSAGLRLNIPHDERDSLNTILKLTLAPSGPAAKDLPPLLVPTRSLARLKAVSASTDAANAKNLVDDDPATQWVSDSRQTWVEIDLGADRRFSRVDIREEGHAWETRTKSFELLVRAEGFPADQWQTIERGSSIGST
jgi:alpha-L-fucosidase